MADKYTMTTDMMQEAVECLREIADPIKFMRDRLNDGEQLSGGFAISLSNDPEYLKKIARAFLAKIDTMEATPLPADAALIGKLRHQLAQATDEAARLRALSQPEVAQVPIEWRRTVRELMTLTNFRPLCQKNVMDGCRCYDCVMERAGAILDEQSPLSATPLPADAALDDAVALLRRTHQNHWPSIEIKAFLAKIDAMPDARLRALSQPEVAQVPAVPMAAIETVLHFCSPHEDASKEDCSKCSAAYEEVSNWRDALLSAAPSAKGGEG